MIFTNSGDQGGDVLRGGRGYTCIVWDSGLGVSHVSFTGIEEK